MNRNRVLEAVPRATPIHDVLGRIAPLNSLRERIDDSRRRLAAVSPVLTAGLYAHVSAGPVDDTGWTLLAASPSVAAKLRQLLPRLEAALRAAGWANCTVRVKVRGPLG